MTGHQFAPRLRRALGAVIAAGTLATTGLASVAGATQATGVTIVASGTGNPGNVGVTLTATPSGGTFTSPTYQWYDCPNPVSSGGSVSGCSPIGSATSVTYTVALSDNAKNVTVAVTDTGGPYVAASYYATTLAVNIAGTATVGPSSSPNELTANASGDNSSFSYQWYDCTSPTSAGLLATTSTVPASCTAINSATSDLYLLAEGDFSKYVTVVATDSTGNVSAVAASVGPVTEYAPVATPSSLSAAFPDTNAGTTGTVSGFSDFANSYNVTITYQWYDCTSQVTSASLSLASGCSTISGATSSSYTLAVSDANLYVLAQVTETNASGSATEYSASTTSAVAVVAPNFTGAPTLDAVSATQIGINSLGSWNGYPPPTSATVTWYRCTTDVSSAPSTLPGTCSTISSFTASNATSGWTLNSYTSNTYTYTYTSADLNRWILIGVQADNGVASTTTAFSASSSEFVGTAPSPSVVPVVSSSPSVGESVSVSQGTWTGVPLPTTFTYQWYDCTSQPLAAGQSASTLPTGYSTTDGCISLGQTAASWTLPTSLSGRTLAGTYLLGEVSTSNGAGTWSYFAVSAQVAAATNSSTGSVTLSSNVNGVYTATPSSFNGKPAPSYAYTWYDCTASVGGNFSLSAPVMTNCAVSATSANASTHAVTAADVTASSGGGLVVVVTATSIAGTSYAYSTDTSLTAALSALGVTVNGQGSQATPFVATATWDAVPAPTISYTWYVCNSSYNGASVTGTCTGPVGTGSTYTATTYNSTYDYAVVVASATNGSGTSTQYSAGSLITPQAPANVVRPSVPFSASTATPLSASPGTWLGVPVPTLTYQWYVCTSEIVSPTSGSLAPGTCGAIPGATTLSYLPSGSYVGDYFLIEVTAINGISTGGSATVSVYSASTVSPLVSTLSVSSVVITGTATVGSTLQASPTVVSQGTYSTAYQWYACSAPVAAAVTVPSGCTAITGATGATFTITVNQANEYVTVLVSVTSNSTTATGVAASTALITTNIPGAPSGVTAVAGTGQATVTWNAPTTGLTATSYTVTATPGGATCTASTVRSCVVTGLLYPTAYTFTVTATNSYGTGPASAASNTVYPTESVPAAPTAVTAVAGTLSATVSWSAASANGAAISLYTVTSSPGGFTCTTTTTSCTVSGLSAGVSYTFTVMARNVVGPGPNSYLSPAVTPRANVPNPPGNITVRRGNAQVTVSWTAGAANGASVSAFVVTLSGPSGSGHCQTAANSCTVTGLVNGARYRVAVVAASPQGSSTVALGPLVVPAGPPSAPGIVRVARGRGVIMVYLSAPTNLNGARVAYYQFLLNGQRWTVQSLKGRLFVRLVGLSGAHVIRVRAVSVGGASAASAPVRFVAIA